MLVVSSIRFLGYTNLGLAKTGVADFLTTATVVFPILASIYFTREAPTSSGLPNQLDFIAKFGLSKNFLKFIIGSFLAITVTSVSAYTLELLILSEYNLPWAILGPIFVILLFVAGSALRDEGFRRFIQDSNNKTAKE
ncbi:MAG: hypothetical protein J07AB43_08580 [Candidatus Nanosalina sp. J07AB43]|nr:MAG: hypothetical protein J07AB43_08580 [Candidatus Nanosalina sp. J07AB43]